MFEGLLDSNMAAYVTTAANAYESSWATYCPEFFGTTAAGCNAQQPFPVPSNSLPAAAAGAAESGSSSSSSSESGSSSSSGSWLQMLIDGLRYAQRLVIPFTVPPQHSASSSAAAAAAAQHQQQQQQSGPPSPQFFTCLGDLYSVAWMEDAEVSDLTQETLLQQYKSIKRRTSQNFTYDQGSHVMQYGALHIDKELAGDYQGMMHNGSVAPTPSFPSVEWIEYEQQQMQMQRGVSLLQRYSNANAAGHKQTKQHAVGKTTSVLQRDADLLPLVHAAQRSTCPRRRAAAAAALRSETSARQLLEASSRAAAAALINHVDVGHLLLANLGWNAQQVLLAAQPAALHAQYTASNNKLDNNKFGNQQQQQQMKEAGQEGLAVVQLQAGRSGSSSRGSLLGEVAGAYVEALLGPLPGREGAALVDSWDCLRGMVQVRQAAFASPPAKSQDMWRWQLLQGMSAAV
jgi:hypothetical protein